MTSRILVAEDNITNQKIVSAILSRAGYEFDLVSDGEAAVQAVQRHSYGLILMDCQMPGMDGLTATRAIRMLAISQPTIIAVTASSLPGDQEDCFAIGMNAFVSKPYKSTFLLELIALSLKQQDDRQAIPEARAEEFQS